MRARIRTLVAIAVTVSIAACGRSEPAAIKVAAAASLRELLEQSVSESNPPTAVFAFDASSTLARQIAAGAAFDVFLSADRETIDRAGDQVVVDSIVPFLGNELVMVTRPGLADPPRSPDDLPRLAGKLALAGPAVPAGKYARGVLDRHGLSAKLDGKIVLADNVRATLALVETGAADAGFVYATDARVAKDVTVAWRAAGADDPGVKYFAALIHGPNEAAAREFLAWFRSDAFHRAATARGFRVE